jgi:glutamine amidotransferase
MIKIIDYGLGNISAFINVYERLNIPVSVAKNADDLEMATKIILPGVGAFDHAMNKLNNSGMKGILDKLVLDLKVPILGICVGMQILAKDSDEGKLPGLGWVDGSVKKFSFTSINVKIQLPHMGWNTICPTMDNPLLTHLSNVSRFYFLHSYYFKCSQTDNVIATTEYGTQFTSVLNHNNIYGVQCHPEKSHQWGIQLLKNFAEL